MESDKEQREKYQEMIKTISKDRLVYVDESGIDPSISKERGWSKVGEVIHGKKSGKSFQRVNVIAGLNEGKSIAPFYFYGSCNTAVFNAWVEKCLLRDLKHGQVVIMDNASFHKSEKTKTLIESAGCELLFLPAYSPDLNPIEKFWATMKRWIKNHWKNMHKITEALEYFFTAIST